MNAIPFKTVFIQGETMTAIADAGDISTARTRTSNPERTQDQLPAEGFDAFGIRPGYSGDGYADINGSDGGAKLGFTIDAPAGTYDLVLRYANGSGTQPRSIAVAQDGAVVATVADTRTGDWGLWAESTVSVTLPGGPVSFTLDTAASNGPNVDAVAFAAPGAPVRFDGPSLLTTAFAIDEGETAVGALVGADPEGDPLAFAIVGGADAALFTVDAAGTLAFVVAPDPATASGTVYEVEVRVEEVVANGEPAGETRLVRVAVGDVPQPTIAQIVLQPEDGAITDAAGAAIPEGGSRTQLRDADNVEEGKDANRAGNSGSGYVDFGSAAGDKITFEAEVERAGEYTLSVRYASNSDRPLALTLNGAAQPDLAMTATDPDGAGPIEGFDTWSVETRTVTLAAGPNTIALAIPAGASTGPNVDAVAITSMGEAASFFAPAIAGDTAFSIDEGQTAIGTVSAADADGADISFALSGPDADALLIDADGVLSFAEAPDFEAPADADGDNTYEATITVSDGRSEVAQAVTVAVADVDEAVAPTAIVLAPVAVAENEAGAVVATVAVAGSGSVYAAADLSLSDDSTFELADVDGGVVLRLKPGVSLDHEAETQPSVTVQIEAADLASEPFVPAPTDVAEDAGAVAFDAATLVSYGGQDRPQAGGQGAIVSDDGATLTLDGNLWKRAPLADAYTITASTRIELEFAVSANVPEISAVGFDLNEDFLDGVTRYQLAGTQLIGRGFADLRGQGVATGTGTERFVIDLSPHAGTTIDSLVFLSDHDRPGAAGLGRSTFSNVRLVEATDAPAGNTAPAVVGGGAADLSTLPGGTIEVDVPIADAQGDALRYAFVVRDADGVDATASFGEFSIDGGVLVGAVPTDVASGAYTVTVTATESDTAEGLSASDAFVLTVVDANDAPVAADPALEPYFAQAGKPLAIDFALADFAAYFSDPDGDALTLSIDPGSLPEGVVLTDEGTLAGTPRGGDTYQIVVRATDPEGLSATVAVDLVVDAARVGEQISIEAEAFTGLAGATNFFATAATSASGERVIRTQGGQAGAVSTDLAAGGLSEGWYTVAIDLYDETDGSATFGLDVAGTTLAAGLSFDADGTFLNPGAPRGGASQAGNLKRIAFDQPVYVSDGSMASLTGQADAELLRIDRLMFTRIDAPDAAPGAPVLDGDTVAEASEGAVVGTLSAADPDGSAALVTFSTDDARFVIDGSTLRLADGVALDHEAGATTAVVVTATDATGASTDATLTLAVTDVNEAPVLADGATLAPATLAAGVGGSIDLAALGATDEDEGQTPTYALRGANGAALPDGIAIDGGRIVVGAGVPAATYAVEVYATDGALESAAVAFDLTVAPVAPFQPIVVQPSDGIVTLSANPDGDATVTFHADRDVPGDAETPGADKILDGGIRAGHSGNGYIDFGDDPGDAATFTFTVPTAGTYDLNIRYASQDSGGSARVLDLSVNGGDPATTPFPSTGPGDGPAEGRGFNTWSFLTQTVSLQAGENVVTLAMADGTSAGPNVDRIEITAAGTGPIPTDTTADADGDLALDGPEAPLSETGAASINLNVGGVDDDVVKLEVSFDGGATRVDVTDIVDSDGDFVVDGSALDAGVRTVTLLATDAAGNVARTTFDVTIAGSTGDTFAPVTIQAEDGAQAAVIDLGAPGTGPAGRSETRVVDAQNPDAFGNFRAGAAGDAYVDFGEDAGDAVAFTVTVPSAGAYTATIRYANGGDAARPLALSANDGAAKTLAFASTGGGDAGWANWTDLTVELDLVAGVNAVRLAIPAAADGGVGSGPNVDQVTFAAVEDDDGAQPGDGRPADAEVFEAVVRVNFEAPTSGNGGFNAPAGYATPEGFESDTGAAYGARGNGFTYGWVDVDDAAMTVTATPLAQPTGSMRYKGAAAEASDLQKTYAHFEYPGAPSGDRERAWEIALENGTYELTVAIGDTAGQYDSNYVLNVEGQRFGPSFEPVNLAGQKVVGGAYSSALDGEGFRSNLYTGIVQVTDGRLTIDSLGGENTEIQWLDIERVPDLTPGDGRSADLDYSKFVSAVAASREDGQVSIEIGEDGTLPIGIDPTSDIVVGVQLQAIDHRGPAVAYTDRVRLVETLTGVETPVNVQVTGGADSLTIRALDGLKENTSYTLVIDDVLDLGDLTDGDAPLRQFQDYTTTFVTGEAPEVVAREVAFVDEVVLDGFADGGVMFTSIEFGPDGRLYTTSITGEMKRWDVNPDGTLDKASVETLALDYFEDTGRSIIGIAFDPSDPNVIWVSDNAPVPREGKADETPEFSGQVTKITLGAGGAFEGAVAETYITGLPRSGGDHVTNSLEFRANPDAGQDGEPDFLLYVMQGSNSAAGRPDNSWGFRPERLLNAAALEIDPSRTAPDGGFDVQTEPYDPSSDAPTYRTNGAFNADGTFAGFYDPFAADAVLRIYGEGIRNGYDLVWHSNGNLYVPTNGTARGGNTLDDPNTSIDESVTGLDKQVDFLFQVQEGGYYGHPNSLLGHYVVNGGNPTAGQDPNSANTSDGGNEYPVGVLPDAEYDVDGAYSLGFNKSPNGATEYRGAAFGASLQGAVLFAQFSQGDNVRYVTVDPVTGRVTGDDVLRRPDGQVIDDYIDPLDIIENPATGQLYLVTLNRGTGESKIVLLTPAPGGVTSDRTADEGGDLALVVIDASDPAAVTFEVRGLDADIRTVSVAFDGGAARPVTLDGADRFTADVGATTGTVGATLTVTDGSSNRATDATTVTLGGSAGASTFIDATAFTVLSTATGNAQTVVRRIDDASTHEANGGNDLNGDGLNDGYDGVGYLDPNGGAEDKASFTYVAAAAGTYTLTFRMASNNARDVTFRAGDSAATVTVALDDFTDWTNFPVVLTLAEGENTIVISQPGSSGPNIDSVTIAPLDVADVTADEGGDLALVATDASDPAAVRFSVTGLDADIDRGAIEVSFDGGASFQAVTFAGGGFTVDLSDRTGMVEATLRVTDGTNVATTGATVALGSSVPNDGTETTDGILFVRHEAESASLIGGPDAVGTAVSDRGQSGGAFVDFDGATDQTIEWTVSVSEAGEYRVDILYALSTAKAARPMALAVDGVARGTLPFAPNSSEAEDQWGPQTVALQLDAGTHTIAVTAPGANGPNVDYLRISAQPVADLTADEGGDLALTVIDASDAGAVVFAVAGLDDDIDALAVSFDGRPAEVITLVDGRFTADVGTDVGTFDAVLTVTDGFGNVASATASVSVVPNGDEDAEIEVRSLDAAFFDDRLHFSFLENDSASNPNRSFKDTAVVELSNPGSATLDIAEATITGPYRLVTDLSGASIEAGGTLRVMVAFDGDAVTPKPTDGQNSVYEGELRLVTNDADSPVAVVDLAGFYQKRDEGGWEPNANEVWQLFGFGNEIEGLGLRGGGENSVLNFFDLYLPSDETEVLSPYWRIADGATDAKITMIAAFHGDGGASLGIHGPGDKGSANDESFGSHAGTHNQRILPLLSNGEFFSRTFDGGFVPDAWLGDDVFGFEVAGLSTDPRLNPSGSGTVTQGQLDARYPGYTVQDGVVFDAAGNEVPDGYTVRMFQAVDAAGAPIANVFLGLMDYTGINYDYNDNMFIVEGVTPTGFGGSLTVSGLDDAAADDRLVFTNIGQPVTRKGLEQTFRDEATITLTNDGFTAVDVTGLTLGGDGAAGFAVEGGLGLLAPGASVAVTVRFTGQDGADDGRAVPFGATLTIETDGTATQTIALSGLAQLQSEQGEEPTVAEIVAAFGYSTDVAQAQLNGGGHVEVVGDEVLMPYLERLDGSKPVEVINLAAFLQQTDISRLNLHEVGSAALTELFAGDDQQGQTVLPDGLVAGDGDTGSVGRAAIDRDEAFGLKVTVDGRPTFAAYTDPEANRADPALGVDDGGHYIRFFQARDGSGAVIEGTFIGVQDYPGGGNFDYNDAVFLVTNVKPHVLTAAEDADGDGVNDALRTDADGDGIVAFLDADDAPGGNAAPTTIGLADLTRAEGAAVTLDVSSAFSDADDDVLTFTADGLPVGLSISSAGVISGTLPQVAADTPFAVAVTASDGAAAATASFGLTVGDVAAPVDPGQRAFGGATPVLDAALTLAAARYDDGGQGVAYNDRPGLQGGGVNGGRPGSDVEVTSRGDVGWIETGEWLEYTIDVARAGTYDLDLLLATNGGGGRSAAVSFTRAGETAAYASSGPIANPNTGGWTTFLERGADGVALEAGEQVVRVTFAGGSQDFRSILLTRDAVAANAAPTTTGLGDVVRVEGSSLTLDVSSAFSDADDDVLTFTADGLPVGLSISSAGVISGTLPQVAADTPFAVAVTASDGAAAATASFGLTVGDVAAPVDPGQRAFGGATPVLDAALTLAAARYDDGGQGVAYNDRPGLQGGGVNGGRPGSDVEVTSRGDVGWIETGEWLEYTIDVARAGTYDLDLLLATNGGGGRSAAVSFTRAGETAAYASSGPIANPNTGGWTTFLERGADGVALEAGEQVVRVTFAGGSQDFRSISLTADGAVTSQPPAPFRIEAEAFTIGANFTVNANSVASAGAYLQAAGNGESRASYTFVEATGVYDLALGHFDESDGQSTMAVRVNGMEVDSFVWNANPAGPFASRDSLVERRIEDVALSAGDVIEIAGRGDGGEPLRTDYLTFTFDDAFLS